MKLFCVISLLVLGLIANSQKLLKGIIQDEAKKTPIVKGLVFLSGTTFGTSPNERGEFTLVIPSGRHSLTVTADGYKTYSRVISSNELPGLLTIGLQEKSSTPLTDNNPYDKKGWQKWGHFFLVNFIGSSANAQDCKIKNTKTIHFRSSEETGEVSAFADEPLLIENSALGYTIEYKLESFKCNFKTGSLSFSGASFFLPMNGSLARQQTWEMNRREAYFGSLMHFMRSVYLNRIKEEGFDVRALRKVLNIPVNQTDSTHLHFTEQRDSTRPADYENQILNADNYRDVISTELIGDSIAYAVDKTTAGLYFENFLLIIYKGKIPPLEYQDQIGGTGITSELVLINKKPIEIESDGCYFNPGDLLALGYWTWSETVSNLLPFDYVPPKR